MANRLYYGDNLEVLRSSIPDESVDLIYLDPPFNSAANYNVLFRAPDGKSSESQMEAFEDTWHWGDSAAKAYDEAVTSGEHPDASTVLRGIVAALGKNDMTAYLCMMAVRLMELHRVLKPTGSLYLHCDPTASHYLKIVLDGIFGAEHFQNEIVWERALAKGDARRRFGRNHDILLFYTKGEVFTFNPVFAEQDDQYRARFRLDDGDGRGPYRLAPLDSPTYRRNLVYEYKGYQPPAKGWRVSPDVMAQLDADGRLSFPRIALGRIARKHYLAEQAGAKIGSVWTGIMPLQADGAERLGYPTQKPLMLLDRIIAASSNPGGVVLDPFCGCGTAVHAAQKSGRAWIGMDLTHLAISLIERRLRDAFPTIKFEVHGTPKDLAGARDLAQRGKHQFEYWAVSLVDAVPQGGARMDRTAKKGADGGIDGIRWVRTGRGADELQRILVSVKGGENINVGMVRDLVGTVEREKALGGVLITLSKPTKPMLEEAAKHGFASTGLGQFRKITIKTVEELLTMGATGGSEPLPPLGSAEGFRKARRETSKDRPEQSGLLL